MNVQTILDDIGTQATAGQIVFSTHTAVALRVQKLLDDPDCAIESLGSLIAADPLLAARTLAVANSAAYNPGNRTITELKSAIGRLGFSTLRSLTASIIVRQLAGDSLSAEQGALSARLWEHTAHVAALSRIIARRITRQNPEAAFLAGILHEIAGFYLIGQSARYPGLFNNDLEPWHEEGEARVGGAILHALDVPESLADALATVWNGFLALPPRSLGDTVLLADEIAPVESPLDALTGMSRRGMDAEIELLIDQQTLSEILAESAAEVASLANALKH